MDGIRANLREIFNLTKQPIIDIYEKNGNISLNVMLKLPPTLMKTISESLTLMLKNGSLELDGFNATKLNIPPQADGKVLISDPKNYTTIIIGVTAASLGATFLLILWIIWNSKKSKAVIPEGVKRFEGGLNVFSVQTTEVQPYHRQKIDSGTEFGGLTEARAQWDIFQKSFNKPAYIWRNQEAVWAGVTYKTNWPNEVPVKRNSDDLIREPDEESKRI